MGIRGDIQADVAEAFDEDLADAVGQFRLTKEEAGEYDTVTGTTASTPTHYYGRGVFGSFDQNEIDGQHIIRTDIKLTVLQNEIADENDVAGVPEIGFLLVNESGVNSWFRYFFGTYDDYRVVQVMQDPAKAAWTIQLRKT